MYTQSGVLIGPYTDGWVQNTNIFSWVQSVIGFALYASSVSTELFTIQLINETSRSGFVKDSIFNAIWAEIKLTGLKTSIAHFNAAIVQETKRRSTPGANESILVLTAVSNGVGDTLPGTAKLKIVSTGDAKGFGPDALVASCEAVFGSWIDCMRNGEEE